MSNDCYYPESRTKFIKTVQNIFIDLGHEVMFMKPSNYEKCVEYLIYLERNGYKYRYIKPHNV